MARSCRATRYQDGMVVQAAGPECSVSVDRAPGRWDAAIAAAVFSGRSGAEDAAEDRRSDVGVVAGLGRGDGERAGNQVLLGELTAGEHARQLAGGFALGGGEGRDVDQRLDVRVADRGVGDDFAAVGVSGEDERTADGGQDAGQVGGVGGHAAQRVRRRDDRVPRRWSRLVTSSQPEASANAPWTSTTVGLGPGWPPPEALLRCRDDRQCGGDREQR